MTNWTPMEEDSQGIMGVVQDGLEKIMTAATRLPYPHKLTVTCPEGFVLAASQAHPTAELEFAPIEGVAMVRFPVTITCIGANGVKMVAVMEQPERISEGNA